MARYLIARLKPNLIPDAKPFGAVIRINPNDGKINSALVDKAGDSTQPLTSVVQKGSRLFLGSLRNSFVGFIDLPVE